MPYWLAPLGIPHALKYNRNQILKDNNRHPPTCRLPLSVAPDTLDNVQPILFAVAGIPRPQPRPRLCRGRVVSTADANARRWVALVEAAARQAVAARGQIPAGAVAVAMAFRFPTPKAARHGLPHTFRPDADNLAKLALDAMMRAGLLRDDAAVSALTIRKVWHPDAGADFALALDIQPPAVQAEQPRPAWVKG